MTDTCLTLLCHADLEERVLDMLLLTPEVRVFSSAPASVHGLAEERLGGAEQVLGRGAAVQVQALLAEPAARALLEKLELEFAGVRLRYWLTPVLAAGVFS